MRCFLLLSTSNVQISRVDIKRFLGTTNTLHALNVSYSKHSYVIRVFEFTIFCCPMLRKFAQKATRKRTGTCQKEAAQAVHTKTLMMSKNARLAWIKNWAQAGSEYIFSFQSECSETRCIAQTSALNGTMFSKNIFHLRLFGRIETWLSWRFPRYWLFEPDSTLYYINVISSVFFFASVDVQNVIVEKSNKALISIKWTLYMEIFLYIL